MGKRTKKLSDEHVDEILRLAATGVRNVDITAQLKKGLQTGSGLQLTPVKVDESAVRYHLHSKADRVRGWRVELYGSAMESPIAWPGWRMAEYLKLYNMALSATVTNNKTGKQVPRPDVRLAASILRDVGGEVEKIGVGLRDPTAHQHLHLHGKDSLELAQILGAKLAEYSRAGLLDDVSALLTDGAPGLELEPIETTAADVPMEADAA